jgi:hypothetical protein
MPDAIPDKLKPEQRQREIARRDFETDGNITGEALAAIYCVDPSLICKDRKSDAYEDETQKLNRSPMIRRIKRSAWKLVAGVIEDGNDARENEGEESKIERGIRSAHWFLEKIRDFDVDVTAEPDNPAADLLTRIFTAPSAELANLKAENAALRERLAAIENRLSALNGQGKEILDGI